MITKSPLHHGGANSGGGGGVAVGVIKPIGVSPAGLIPTIPASGMLTLPKDDYYDTKDKDLRLLGMRMRWASGQLIPFAHLSIHTSAALAIVFIVHKGQPVVLEDDPGLFPSDDLITKLRLLLG